MPSRATTTTAALADRGSRTSFFASAKSSPPTSKSSPLWCHSSSTKRSSSPLLSYGGTRAEIPPPGSALPLMRRLSPRTGPASSWPTGVSTASRPTATRTHRQHQIRSTCPGSRKRSSTTLRSATGTAPRRSPPRLGIPEPPRLIASRREKVISPATCSRSPSHEERLLASKSTGRREWPGISSLFASPRIQIWSA